MTNILDDILARYTIQPYGCWEWEDSCDTTGYGRMRFEGKQQQVHRLSWLRNKGPIPEGLFVLHKCDNRKCLNPDHLFLGNHADNAADREAKGRGANRSGADNGHAYLNENEVRAIRTELAAGTACAELAERYNVSWPTIKYIKIGKTWRNVQ